MVELHTVPRWYALHVRSNYELAVSSRLRELGVDEYVPIKHCRSVPKRNRFSDGTPLFPGYVFSFLNLAVGPRLYTVPGVIRILGYRGTPTPVEEEEMLLVRRIVSSRLQFQAIPYLSAGDPIVLTGGPLSGVKGSFMASKKGGHLIVSLPLINRSLSVAVQAEWVARCEPSADV